MGHMFVQEYSGGWEGVGQAFSPPPTSIREGGEVVVLGQCNSEVSHGASELTDTSRRHVGRPTLLIVWGEGSGRCTHVLACIPSCYRTKAQVHKFTLIYGRNREFYGHVPQIPLGPIA